jgi:hypothetical protein
MKILVLVLGIAIFSSCAGDSPGHLSGSDSLVINFNEPQSNNIEKTVITTEENAINKLARFTSGDSATEYKCGYDGNLQFYKNGELTGDVSFNYSGENCRHFIQLKEGKLTSTKMSNEAADFLKSLREGKSWY